MQVHRGCPANKQRVFPTQAMTIIYEKACYVGEASGIGGSMPKDQQYHRLKIMCLLLCFPRNLAEILPCSLYTPDECLRAKPYDSVALRT